MSDLKQPAFGEQEYHRRVHRVQERMRVEGLDAILCTSLANICYLTGVESPSVHATWLALLEAEGDPTLLCVDFESHNARVFSWLKDWRTVPLGGDHLSAAVQLITDRKLAGKRVTIEGGRFSSLTAQNHQDLRPRLDGVELVETTELIERVRSVKSDAEVAYMRQAGEISARAMRAAIDTAAEGVTDNDLAAAAYQSMIAAGSEYPCYPVFVTAGERSGIPHTTFRRRRLRRADPVFLEVGACICRYSSPILRTAVIGEPSDQVRRMADACCASVNTMIDTIRPGLAADEVARTASSCLDHLPAGLVWHGYFGYSVGLGFSPTWSDCVGIHISMDNPTVLEPGMTYHCSTSLRDPGRCGTTCSETVLITDSGCDVLTGDLPRQLFVR